MIPKLIKSDPEYDEWCEEEIISAYKTAAQFDDFLFGDYDYLNEWLGNS
jgi:hypothetical protein